MLFADTYITADPAWPWSLPGLGWPVLAGVALVLMLLSVWTYVGVRGVTMRRLLAILALRLGALLVACLLVLRPSLARQEEETIVPSKIILLIDASDSMNFTDEFNNHSRWDNARRILASPDVTKALQRLAVEHKVEIVYYQGAEGIAKFDPQGQATGKRTDVGAWLHDLQQVVGKEGNLRGLIVFSDGADNGTRFPPLKEAALWTGIAPIYTFGLGKATTSLSHRDIAFVDIQVPTEPVPVKTQFTVRGSINAPGFVGTKLPVKLWIENAKGDMVLATGAKTEEPLILSKELDNEIVLTRDAPLAPGEYKVTLKFDPVAGEVNVFNNEISSYITVSKDGVSILWVEGHQRLESTFVLRHALFKDRRFRVYPALKVNDAAGNEEDFFNLDKQHYDVIVLGDISAKRFAGTDAKLFEKVKQKITKEGTGLLLVGGLDALGNGDWGSCPLADLLPVTLGKPGQVEAKVQVKPTRAGLDHFLMRLADDPKENDEIWKKFEKLDGITPLGTAKLNEVVLATGEGDEPILVGTQRGAGRILVFGGDTTYKSWRRDAKAVPAFERFWKQTMLWLAHQENVEGNVWIKPDKRRLSANGIQSLGFEIGLRGKGGNPLEPTDMPAIEVIGPDKTVMSPPSPTPDKTKKSWRGNFYSTSKPGEYRIKVKAKSKDTDGKELTGEASARFMTFTENLENLRPAADHDFLAKLAQAGGGRFALADEQKLLRLVDELVKQKRVLEKPRVDLWPDWRRNPPVAIPGLPSTLRDQLATLWSSAALPSLLLFATFLSLEWFLRRRWGLV